MAALERYKDAKTKLVRAQEGACRDFGCPLLGRKQGVSANGEVRRRKSQCVSCFLVRNGKLLAALQQRNQMQTGTFMLADCLQVFE